MVQDGVPRKRNKEGATESRKSQKSSSTSASKTSRSNDVVLSSKNDKVRDIVNGDDENVLRQKIKEKLAQTYSRLGVIWSIKFCINFLQAFFMAKWSMWNHKQIKL